MTPWRERGGHQLNIKIGISIVAELVYNFPHCCLFGGNGEGYIYKLKNPKWFKLKFLYSLPLSVAWAVEMFGVFNEINLPFSYASPYGLSPKFFCKHNYLEGIDCFGLYNERSAICEPLFI